MPIVVGSPRSGTTLLRLMLDAHPELAIPPETGFLPAAAALQGRGEELRERFFALLVGFPPEAPGWSDFGIPAEAFEERLRRLAPFTVAEGCRLFYRMYAERFGKPRWGEKTPLYGLHLEQLEALLPEARFVHLVRDGRDAAVSLRDRWFSPGRDIAVQAAYWRDNVAAIRSNGSRCRHFLEVRFEDLICDAEAVQRRICDFLELRWDAAMLEYHRRAPLRLEEHGARRRSDGSLLVTREERLRQQEAVQRPPDRTKIGIWRGALAAAEVDEFESVAGEQLARYGYPLAAPGGVEARLRFRG